MRYGTIIDYAKTQFADFRTVPFNNVDAAILSQLAYAQLIEPYSTLLSSNTQLLQRLDQDNEEKNTIWRRIKNRIIGMHTAPVRLSDHDRFTSLYDALCHAEMYDRIFPSPANREQMISLMQALVSSPRYRDVQVGEFLYELREERYNDQQFAAMTFLLPNEEEYIAFRGTEATFVGWREDFQLAYDDVIPSQTSAVKYVNLIASRSDRPINVLGHSKGGNTAVYAAVYCDDDVRARMKHIYSFDGPGFMTDILDTPQFRSVQPRLTKLIPQDSFIGMMFEKQEPSRVIQSSALGINQHFIFTWNIDMESLDFVPVESLTQSAQNLSDAYIEWTNSLDTTQRRDIIDAMFEIAEASGYDNFTELADNISEAAPKMWEVFKNFDEKKRDALVVPFTNLFSKIFQFNWSTARFNPATWNTRALSDGSVIQTLHSIAGRIADVVTPSDSAEQNPQSQNQENLMPHENSNE